MENKKRIKKAIGIENFVFLAIFLGIFITLGTIMGGENMMKTLMETSYDLLISTVFYIMAVAVLAGAISSLLIEFGVVSLINKLLSPLMKPLYDLPGASIIGILTTYLSDNPAILTLADDNGFKSYFKKYQLPALTNMGTAFGMGLIITTFMISNGKQYVSAAIIGNIGAIIGSIVSTRIMLIQTAKIYGKDEMCISKTDNSYDMLKYREIREGSVGQRFLSSLLEGGASGVNMGLAIIPGVIIICTFVMMLTNGPSVDGIYTGAAYEGIGLLPWIGSKINFILKPLFGFTSPEAIAFPITSLGAVGAAMGLVPKMLSQGLIGANDIAVFTAMGMCWSGYLSTHVAMMDGLKCRELTGKAILSHTIGGLVAGISAHYLYLLFQLF